jgi:hypothetical protein
VYPASFAGQFEQPYGPMGPPTLFAIPVSRYMRTYGLRHEQLAMVPVVQGTNLVHLPSPRITHRERDPRGRKPS